MAREIRQRLTASDSFAVVSTNPEATFAFPSVSRRESSGCGHPARIVHRLQNAVHMRQNLPTMSATTPFATRLSLVAGCTLLLCGTVRATDPPDLLKKTYTYKTVGDVKIQADVHRTDDEKVRPVVVWIHGGALIMGNRNSVPKNLLDLCRAEGFALVSLDYRLAPEVKVPEIIADIEDAFRWLREQGPKLGRL